MSKIESIAVVETPEPSAQPADPRDLLALKDRVLAATSEGVTIGDARRSEHPIIYANAGFERLTGYSVGEILGRNCRFLQGPETDPGTVEEIRRAIRTQRGCTVEILNYRKDGTPFWNRLSITPVLDEAGEVSHHIGIQSDITARRHAQEAERRARRELESANEKMRRDLEAAAEIQRSFLPASLPEAAGVRLAWEFHPCEALAGDTLNVLRLDRDHLGLYVLDVSGHGVPAALLSVTLTRWLSPSAENSCLYSRRPSGSQGAVIASPAEVAEALNRQFPFDARTGQYFTLVYAVLDLRDGSLRYVTAGSPPPILVQREGQSAALEARGFPVGIVPEPAYVERRAQLREGDRVYLYTDGLVEASSEEGPFGEERLRETLETGLGDSLEASLGEVRRAVGEWRGSSTLEDDYSILALEIEGG